MTTKEIGALTSCFDGWPGSCRTLGSIMVHYMPHVRPHGPSPSHDDSEKDVIRLEIDAMQVIAESLQSLPNAASRDRVLRWISERFGVPIAPSASAPAAATTEEVKGPHADLAVDGLEQFFDEQPKPAARRPTPAQTPTRLDSMVRDFAADFQRFADELNGRVG